MKRTLSQDERKSRRINYRRQARIKAGLSEKRAAQLAGVALSTFRYYESGGPVPYHAAFVLSQAYGCRLELFNRSYESHIVAVR